MNRKQRRAALKQSPPAGGRRAAASGDPVSELFAQSVRSQQQNQLPEATRLYKRLLALKPDHAEASNNLGCVLQAQGKLTEASQRFAQALTLMPQLFDQFSGVCGTLVAVLPPIGEAIRRTMAAWPNRLTIDQMFGDAGLAAIAADPMLLCMLQSIPARQVALERLLTALRAALLAAATDASTAITDAELAFSCALAKQCFINEYVFATTPQEDEQVDRLNAALERAIASGGAIASNQVAAAAMYQPLHVLPGAQKLVDITWPAAVDDLLTQQLREPAQEHDLRSSILRLTPIDDDVSRRVRQQYEENPYPRWVNVAGHPSELTPPVAFAPLANTDALDVLVAGCGTGWHAIATAQKYQRTRITAVDLSLSSLCYAKRKTPAELAERISYAQADILKLGALGRTFDIVDASGVLHHMADPIEGWRILLSLLRPGGFMHVALYSQLGRRDVVAARDFIAARGYAPTPADIRRCRQDLLETPLHSVARFTDFFSTSECRDLLFHVQESRTDIPAIKAFVAEHALTFIGFEFEHATLEKYRTQFANAGWSMSDLDRWHAVETQYPDTFSSMYQFWLKKS
jgi:SAM-dependent methyltransferase